MIFSMRGKYSPVLNTAVIYGPNGSGKSNLIRAMAFMKDLVLHHTDISTIKPHKACGDTQESKFLMQIMIDEVRYAYGFTVKEKHITEEFLYWFPDGKETMIFEQDGLSDELTLSDIAEGEKAYRFFRDQLMIYDNDHLQADSDDGEESDGIRKLNALMSLMQGEDRVLIADGLDTGLHPLLVRKLLHMRDGTQLIFTAYEAGLMDYFTKDAVWFTELKENTKETDLYSLLELKGVRDDISYSRAYLRGCFGAVPRFDICS